MARCVEQASRGALSEGAWGVLTVALALGWIAPGCDTGAVGIDACRTIEYARCEAVMGCAGSPIEDEDDVDDCKLFYRDQCLHGIADFISPDQATVEACVEAIRLARACWDWDPNNLLADCNTAALEAGVVGPQVVYGTDPNATGCDAIMTPQILQECAFLQPPPPAPEGGSGGTGQGGAGGGG